MHMKELSLKDKNIKNKHNNKMTKHEIKTCPRCKKGFECKSGDILRCQCETVKLTQVHRDYIAQQFDDCLCAKCLSELRAEVNIKDFTQQMSEIAQQR